MDLLATVRKEGSRGGRGDFKWTDVQTSSHRENYLGHSLMAPVGRWQKGRDLNWYAKGESNVDGEDPAEKAARERKEEIRRVKEAEEDALARALGLPVAPRDNPNTEALGNRREVEKMVKEAAEVDGAEGNNGVGYGDHGRGSTSGVDMESGVERLEGNAEQQDKELHYALKEYRRRHGERSRGSRSRSKDPDQARRRHRSRERRHRHRPHSRSTERTERKHRRSRSPSRSKDRDYRDRRRDRNRSPRRHHDDREDNSRKRRDDDRGYDYRP